MDTDGYHLYKLYQDLFLTDKERENRLREGIHSSNLSKIRCNAGDKVTSNKAKEVTLGEAYSNKYRIPIDNETLNEYGVFHPSCLNEELVFELNFNFNGKCC